MLCPNCPKRETCQTPCSDLERELARIEKPLRETLKNPRQLQRISDSIAAAEFYQSRFSAEQMHENEEEAEEARKLYQALHCALEELTPKQQECVRLRYWEDMSSIEIAETLGVARQVVQRRLDSAQHIIRKYLTDLLKTGCAFAQYK